MLLFILTFAWILYAMVDGFVNAHYYDMHPEDKGHINLHAFYNICRGVILSLMFGIVYMKSSFWLSLFYIVTPVGIFSFFHNGTYYTTRNWLNPHIYKKRWWDHSETSTALIEIGTGFRTAMAVFGIIGLAFVWMEFKNYINI